MAIEARGLTKLFETGRRRSRLRIEAVHKLDLTVSAGERVAYIGPNGAGKSTSIKILTGILHPTAGKATVLGLTPWEDRRRLARRIGTLFGQRCCSGSSWRRGSRTGCWRRCTASPGCHRRPLEHVLGSRAAKPPGGAALPSTPWTCP